MTGTCYPNALTLLQTIDTYYASKFAKLVGMLDGIKNARRVDAARQQRDPSGNNTLNAYTT